MTEDNPQEPDRAKASPETHTRTWTASGVSAVVSAVGVVVAVVALIIQSYNSQSQLEQANRLAWDYQSSQQCVNYRGEVLRLWELGLNEQQIKSWVALETGGPVDNPGVRTAYEDRIGCGRVEDLADLLPRERARSSTAGS